MGFENHNRNVKQNTRKWSGPAWRVRLGRRKWRRRETSENKVAVVKYRFMLDNMRQVDLLTNVWKLKPPKLHVNCHPSSIPWLIYYSDSLFLKP
jgi:hypothetical protein